MVLDRLSSRRGLWNRSQPLSVCSVITPQESDHRPLRYENRHGLDRSASVATMRKRRSTHRLIIVIIGAWILAIVCLPRWVGAEEPLPGTWKLSDPRAVGMAQAVRAAGGGVSGIYLNPATIAMAPLYHIDLSYRFTGPEQLHTGGIAIVDSVTSLVAAGVSFDYSGIEQPRTTLSSYDGRLALAGGFGDVLFVGLTGRYLRLEHNIASDKWGPGGVAALPASGSRQAEGLTFDAGLALALGDVISVGVAGYNLTNTKSVYAPLQVGGGIGASFASMVLIEADAVVDFTSHDSVGLQLNAGGELFVMGKVALRAGYGFDAYYKRNSLSGGLGYVDARFAVDVGYMHELLSEGRFTAMAGLRIFVN